MMINVFTPPFPTLAKEPPMINHTIGHVTSKQAVNIMDHKCAISGIFSCSFFLVSLHFTIAIDQKILCGICRKDLLTVCPSLLWIAQYVVCIAPVITDL